MESLPNELKALIACYLGSDLVGDKVREMAKNAKIFHTDSKGRTYINGLLHSVDDQPCVVNCYKKEWRKMGKLHRFGDKPAVIYENGNKFWFSEGVETKALLSSVVQMLSSPEGMYDPEYKPANDGCPESYREVYSNNFEYTCYHPETESEWEYLRKDLQTTGWCPEGKIIVSAEEIAKNPLIFAKRTGSPEYLEGWVYLATLDENNYTGRGGYFIDEYDRCVYEHGYHHETQTLSDSYSDN